MPSASIFPGAGAAPQPALGSVPPTLDAPAQVPSPPAQRTGASADGRLPPQPRTPAAFSAIVLADADLAEHLYRALTAAGALDVRFATSAADLLRHIPGPPQSGIGVLCRSPRAEAMTQLILAMRHRGWRRLVIACQDGGESAVRMAIAAKVRCLVRQTDTEAATASWVHWGSLLPAGWDGLSKREIEVLQAVADGRTNKDAGESLGLSGLTVKSHLARIGRKTGTGDRAEMVGIALRAGLIT